MQKPHHLTSDRVCFAARITYRQLDHWTRSGYVAAEDATPGSGRQRYYSADEMPKILLLATLVRAGIMPFNATQLINTGTFDGSTFQGHLGYGVIVAVTI